MKNRKKIKTIILVVLVLFCIWYLKNNATYTSYSSNVTGQVEPKIASWKIFINNTDITTSLEKEIEITDIDWSGNRVENGKVAPGSIGKMRIEINPTQTEVALRYDIEIIDKTIDESILLNVKNISQSNVELIKTGENTYSSLITLDMLEKKVIPVITIDVAWENDDTINDLDNVNSKDDNFLKINFKATQYLGEEIVPYQ